MTATSLTTIGSLLNTLNLKVVEDDTFECIKNALTKGFKFTGSSLISNWYCGGMVLGMFWTLNSMGNERVQCYLVVQEVKVPAEGIHPEYIDYYLELSIPG